MNSVRVLVIGGGVAGAACAIELRKRGIEVTLAERDPFPRIKVCGCCLGGAGIRLLEQTGVLPAVRAVSADTHTWRGYLDGRLIEIPSGDGIAVSREHLDPILIAEAKRLGTDVLQPCEAAIVDTPSNQVQAKLGSQVQPFDCVVIAAGLKSGNVGGRLPWIETPHGPFGMSVMATSTRIDRGVIYMACDDEGYVGLVQLDDGRVDVAAALRPLLGSSKTITPMQRVRNMLDRSGVDVDLDPIGNVLTTPPLRRTRQSGNGRVIAIGDASGYVEPFTGEGMTWALQSGKEAAQLIDTCRLDLLGLGERWNQHSRTMLATKKRTCRIVTTALRSRTARQVAARTLGIFPGIARPLITQLNKA
ncbi:FAD-dependent oxidoreductase [Rubripirellula amarantea]|nr:FAD-dependent oxidoreductase [Rubripirellula amarantea]